MPNLARSPKRNESKLSETRVEKRESGNGELRVWLVIVLNCSMVRRPLLLADWAALIIQIRGPIERAARNRYSFNNKH